MKAITLHQPWASLVAVGAKTIETRSWSTKYRGPIAIHAAKKDTDRDMHLHPEPWAELGRHIGGDAPPRGAVVAIADLVDIYPIIAAGDTVEWARPYVAWWTGAPPGPGGSLHIWEEDEATVDLTPQAPFGDYRPGRFAWLLENIRPLDPPRPATGKQGLWTWEVVPT